MAMSEETLGLVTLLFSTYTAFQSGDSDTALVAYDIALAGQAQEDITAGLALFLQGLAPGHNKSFAPPGPLVAEVVRSIRDGRLERLKWDREAIAQIEARDTAKEFDLPTRKVIVQRMFDDAKLFRSEKPPTPEMIAKKKASDAAYVEMHDKIFNVDHSPAATAKRLGYSVGAPESDEAAA